MGDEAHAKSLEKFEKLKNKKVLLEMKADQKKQEKKLEEEKKKAEEEAKAAEEDE